MVVLPRVPLDDVDEQSGAFVPNDADACASALSNEGSPILILLQPCRKRSRSVSTRSFFCNSVYVRTQ